MQWDKIDFVNLDPVLGREQQGRRPVVVVSDDWINSRPLVVPGTGSSNVKQDYSTNGCVSPEESGLARETTFTCFQARVLTPAASRVARPATSRRTR